MTEIAILNIEGKESGKFKLDQEVFGGYVNEALIHQAVVKYQASLRQGTLSTKERGEVSGGGRKPYKQKGTGRARVGSIRSPLYVGGGVTFGPKPRDFSYSIPKKMKSSALQEALKSKLQNGNLICINDLTDPFSKTKEFFNMLKTLQLNGKVLAILDGSDASVQRVSRNLPRYKSMRSVDVNAYDVMRSNKVLVTKSALEAILQRIQK